MGGLFIQCGAVSHSVGSGSSSIGGQTTCVYAVYAKSRSKQGNRMACRTFSFVYANCPMLLHCKQIHIQARSQS